MKVLFAISLLLLANSVFAKITDSIQVYQWEDITEDMDPLEVKAISFRKMKLDSLPKKLAQFENLEYLILSKNRLTELPDFIGEMTKIVHLDLSQNKFSELPEQVCSLSNLEELILNRNLLSTLPSCISNNDRLHYIDLWDNPIRTLPESFTEMTSLRKVDLTGIKFAPSFQEKWGTSMPQVTFIFEEPCNCME